MKHVMSYAAYPTQGIEAGRANFALYVRNHIYYLKAANNPAYSSIITETQTLYDGMFGVISLREQNFNQRISLTQNLHQLKKEFSVKIDELEEVIVYKFHKNSAVYNEIFPHGVTPYKTAPLSEIILKMKLAESLAEKYSLDIGDTYKLALKNIRVKFEAEVQAQLMASGEVKNVIPDYKAKRLEMDKQLLKNICTLIVQNLDHLSVVEEFFDEHLIFPKKSKKEEEKPYTLRVLPSSFTVADISLATADSLLISNTAAIPMYYYGAATIDAVAPAVLNEILPDEEIEISAVSLGAPVNKFLIFVNKDKVEEGEIEIVLV